MLKHPDGRGTVVPVHSGEIIGAGLMSKIQKDIGVDREYFIESSKAFLLTPEKHPLKIPSPPPPPAPTSPPQSSPQSHQH